MIFTSHLPYFSTSIWCIHINIGQMTQQMYHLYQPPGKRVFLEKTTISAVEV